MSNTHLSLTGDLDLYRSRRIFSMFALLAVLALPMEILAASGTESEEQIVSPDAEVVKVFGEGFFTEGPAVATDGTVYFSDITYLPTPEKHEGGHILKYNPGTGKTTIFRSPSGMSNGIKFDALGRMVVAEGAGFGGRRVIRTDMKTGRSEILAALYKGRPFNSPNDLTIDEKGRIYFTDPRYVGNETVDLPVMGVYRIDPDKSVHLIIADAGKPNGIAVSPDQKTLYVVCHDNGTLGIGSIPDDLAPQSGRMALLAYDLASDGRATFRKTLIDYSPGSGPDGLVVDVKGNLYVTVPDPTRSGVFVYSPDGEELAHIKTPERPANVAFGRGATSRTLYITAQKSLYWIKVNNEGYHLPAK